MHIIFKYKVNITFSSFKIANLDKLKSIIINPTLKIGNQIIEIMHTFDGYTISDVCRCSFKFNDDTAIPFDFLINNYIKSKN